MSYNSDLKFKNIGKEYPLTKIILPPHLREEQKKTKIISINKSKSNNINNQIEKKRIDDFLELYNIKDK